jgi:hypothetical protein
MAIHIDCPVCGQKLNVSNFAAGRVTKCTACGKAVRVPQPKTMLQRDSSDDERARFSLGELFAWSIEKLSGGLDSLVERPVRILVIILLLAAGYLGMATTKWALSKTEEAPTATASEPVDPEPWEGVGLTDANEQVRVTAQSANTEQIMVTPPDSTLSRKTPKAYLKIVLKIENLGLSELKYTGWSARKGNNSQAAKIKDDTGGVHEQMVWDYRVVGQTVAAPIPVARSIEDILIFEHPGTYAKYLKLALPAEAYGGTGELRIKLPQTRFLD